MRILCTSNGVEVNFYFKKKTKKLSTRFGKYVGRFLSRLGSTAMPVPGTLKVPGFKLNPVSRFDIDIAEFIQ